MDFAVIGTLGDYVKTKNLAFAAKHKIRTGQTLTNSNGNFVSIMTPQFDKIREAVNASTKQAKQAKLRRIKQKLMNGRKISDEEMGFLRVNDPKTYKKAKHAEEAREELKAELKKAESKSEAREIMTRAMIKASTEAMAELGALGQCNGGTTGGNTGGVSMSPNSDASSMDISGGAVSAEGNTADATENQTFSEVNQSVAENNSAENSNDADKNSSAQKKSDDDSNTPEDIMEKYIMTIRALEDEWARFTNSDEYKNLPENTLDDKHGKKIVNVPKRTYLNAVANYRKSMHYLLYAE